MAQKRPAPTRGRFQLVNDEGPRPKKRKIGRPKLEVVAPQASLDGLPDNILLIIMGLLDVHSLISLSRVSRRFHHLHGDESIWSDVDLTLRSLGRRLDTRKLKKIIHTYLPSSLWRIKLSSNSQSISSKNALVTEALLNDLFTRCPTIEALTLQRCDLTNFSGDCKLFHSSSLESVSLIECHTNVQWMEDIKPSWPNLRHLSFHETVKTSDFELKYIAGCKDWSASLKSLILQGCYRITNTGVQAVCSDLKSLRELDITGCPQVSRESLDLNDHLQLICSSS